MIARISSPLLKREALQWLHDWTLPPEVTARDFLVTLRSSLLEGAGRVTRTALHHRAFRTDETVVRQVLQSLLDEASPSGPPSAPSADEVRP